MLEPGVAVGTGLAILGSKDVLVKILGPTADYVGGELRGLVEKCNINLDRVFQKAARKLGNRLEEDGQVSPRVLKHVIDEARFCEDELAAEYYGGVLASSRNPISRDDRGVTLLAVLKDLSVYQIRFHFLVYSLFNEVFKGESHNLGDVGETIDKMSLFVPMHVYTQAMDFGPKEKGHSILSHCLFGLSRHGLIAQNFHSGNKTFINKHAPKADSDGIIVAPTLLGSELFLWSLGVTGASGLELLRVTVSGGVEGITIPDGAVPVERLKAVAEHAGG